VIKYQLPPLLWIAIIFTLSSIPKLQLRFESVLGADKIAHAVMFCVLCLLVRRAFFHQDFFPLLKTYALLGAFIFAVVYGILDEYHQTFVPGRVSDFYDVLANTGGALLYVGISWLTRPPKGSEESSQAS
jgi:VanZ family protein